MKRFVMMALVAVLALSFAAPAFAVEVNMSGKWENAFQWSDNTNFYDYEDDNTSEDDFFAYQRVRFYWEAVASENLRGVFGLQSTMDYGRNNGSANDSQLGADTVGITREDTYIDFNWPNTALRIRMGFWYLEPPTNFGAPVWNDDVAGVSASYAFNDMVSATLFYARLSDLQVGGGDVGTNYSDEVDAFGLILPIAGDGFNLTPWVMYAAHGQNASGGAGVPIAGGLTSANATGMDDDVQVWWAGAQFSMNMFDPFIIYADAIYGAQDGAQEQNDRSGWWFDFAVDYTGLDMVTPRLFFAYGTGEDDDLTDGSERLPTLGGESCGCGITSFGMDGSAGWRTADSLLIGNGYGFWTVGVSLLDFSFIESVSHTFTVAYGQGTNDKDSGVMLTEDDSFWEVNFDTKYQMYENLAAYLELGYIDVSLDDDVWANDDTEAASKAAFIFQYSF